MKNLLSQLAMACFIFCVFSTATASPAKVQITAQSKHSQGEKNGKGSEGSETTKTEKISYTFTIKNTSFSDLPDLVLNYIIFVERQKLGQKRNTPPDIERINGTQNLEGLKKQGSVDVTPADVTLSTKSLVGNYHFDDGGLIRAVDSIAGVWIRVQQGDQIVGEYAMPSTITKRGWEK